MPSRQVPGGDDLHPALKKPLQFLTFAPSAAYAGAQASYRYVSRKRQQHKTQKLQDVSGESSLPGDDLGLFASQDCNAQSGCMLLALPWELRYEIYKQVLGDRRVYIDMDYNHGFKINQVYPHVCSELDTQFDLQNRSCPNRWSRRMPRPKERADPNSRLALLQTCRKIRGPPMKYTDAADILYTSNTFQPLDNKTLLHLPNILLPHRFQMIRTLEMLMDMEVFKLTVASPMTVEYHRPKMLKEYARAWDLLRLMKDLRVLRVEVEVTPFVRGCWDFILPQLEEPVSRVSGPRVFELYLCRPSAVRYDSTLWGSCTVYGVQEKEADRYLTPGSTRNNGCALLL